MKREVVQQLVDEAIAENSRLFLIELNYLPDNKIIITVDGDDGVSVKECVRISRHVEHNLDREEEDFSLEVTTPGATTPFTDIRQYKKSIGRVLEVKTETEKFTATLTKATDEEISLEWKVREPKPIGKGKVTVVKTATLKYNSIKEAKVKIIF
jgi:ribosome maturation factor RimP